MSAELQTTIWGIAVFIPLLLNIATKRRVDAVGLSAMLVLIWTLSRVFWLFDGAPASMEWYGPVDLIGGATVLAVWRQGRQGWKLALALTYAVQLSLHVAFWMAWIRVGGRASGGVGELLLWRYIAMNNALFVMQLVCAGSPGVRRVAVVAFARMSHRLRRNPHARA